MLYGAKTREAAWQQAVSGQWDIIVVGGGITGAGILREAARLGLRILLLEQNDFASGTSSRSSKLVHGGLRYLNNLQFGLTHHSVMEREVLLREGPGLIKLLPFLYPTYEQDHTPGWMMEIGLWLYAWLGRKWCVHQELDPIQLRMMAPGLSGDRLTGGFRFYDAQTDDARLVLRVIREGVASGRAIALNYAQVNGLVRDVDGRTNGVVVCDRETGDEHTIHARAVVNATGAWADHLRQKIGREPRIRPLRGSHLVFSARRFPVYQAVSFPHPDDGRPVFVFPWEGVTLLGTTDLDHHGALDTEPHISPQEVAYLLEAVKAHFPRLALSEEDVLATFAGVRPVLDSGEHVAPSKESREHVLWNEDGLLTVTGGKLTTFRLIALDVLKALQDTLPGMPPVDYNVPALDPIMPPLLPDTLPDSEWMRLIAHYGPEIVAFVHSCPPDELQSIKGLPYRWFELRWAARYEAVRHLDDLLLRRLRLGLLRSDGGTALLMQIRPLVQHELGWNDVRWNQETTVYIKCWNKNYSLPDDQCTDTDSEIAA